MWHILLEVKRLRLRSPKDRISWVFVLENGKSRNSMDFLLPINNNINVRACTLYIRHLIFL